MFPQSIIRTSLPFAIAFGVLQAPLMAHVSARPYAPALTCERLKGLIEQKGAAVVSTGRFTYDRFVRDQGYCMTDEITEPAWIVSSDNAECYIGYTCGEREQSVN